MTQTIPNPGGVPAKTTRGLVLIVDDEEHNRTILKDPLEAQGYEVWEAANGEDALRQVAQRQPDVILLDVMMPRMDGFEVCRRLKSNPHTITIPILMVTALSERHERLLGIEAGANDYLTKPVDRPDLMLRVANAVNTKKISDLLQAERLRSEQLLFNILPQRIANRMKAGETNIADYHPKVIVLHAELIDFASLAAHIGPDQMVSLLNEIFSQFDLLVEAHFVEKIKTMGDAYLVAAGLPVLQAGHAGATAGLAREMQRIILRFNQEYRSSVRLRIGISSGPVVAGVIGHRKFAYDLWGEAVDIARQLAAAGEAGAISVDAETQAQLAPEFGFELPHRMDLKGRGEALVYRLREDKPQP